MSRKYNKTILISLKILLFIIGFTIGFLAVWQVFQDNPDLVKGWLKIMFYIVCGIVPAVILFLSSKPLYILLSGAGNKIMSRLSGIKGESAVGVVLCIVLGAITGYLCDVLLSLFIPLLALRIIIDSFVALLVLYGTAVMFFKLISAHPVQEKEDGESDGSNRYSGYIFTQRALQNEKTIYLIENWLCGDMFILSATLTSLFESEDERAKETYENVSDLRDMKLLSICLEGETGKEDELIKKFAAAYNLKIVAADEDETRKYQDCENAVLDIGQL